MPQRTCHDDKTPCQKRRRSSKTISNANHERDWSLEGKAWRDIRLAVHKYWMVIEQACRLDVAMKAEDDASESAPPPPRRFMSSSSHQAPPPRLTPTATLNETAPPFSQLVEVTSDSVDPPSLTYNNNHLLFDVLTAETLATILQFVDEHPQERYHLAVGRITERE